MIWLLTSMVVGVIVSYLVGVSWWSVVAFTIVFFLIPKLGGEITEDNKVAKFFLWPF